MKKITLLALVITLLNVVPALSQCTTSNATSCSCATLGSTDCDLLPDIIVGRPPLLVSGNNGVIEYSQVGNGVENGRLRVSVSSPNIGHGPLEIRTTTTYICGVDTITGTAPATCPNTGLPPRQLVVQRVYHKNGSTMSYYDRDAGSMTYHPTHGHMHVDDWGTYTLRSSNGDPDPLNWPIIGTGAKLAFCLMDYGSCSTYNGHCVDALGNVLLNGNFPNYGLGGGAYNCSQTMQGISSGYTDIYYQYLDGMYLNIPPGTCNGNYFIVVQIDPHNYFLEENENNNVIVVPYTLTKQSGTVPVISASGSTALCPGGSVTLTSSSSPSYLWSTGDTTQSITVSQLGNYSVTTDVNTSCPASSLPISITAQNVPVTATPVASAVCEGQSTTINSSMGTPPTGIVQTSFTNSNAYSIPDNIATGVSSPITVSGLNPAALNAGSVFSVEVNLTHTYTGDLILSLISPSGNAVKLSNRRGAGGDNFTGTIFSMTASTPIANGAAPYTGSFVPDEFFSLLTGNINGTWELKVADVAAVDTGSINSWTLKLSNEVPAPLNYSWTSVPAGFTSSDPNPLVTPNVATTYTLNVYNTLSGCTGTTSATVNVNLNPSVSFAPMNDVCSNQTSITLNQGNPSGGNYSGTGVFSNLFYPPLAGAGTHTLTYNYTDGNGCLGSASQTINVTTTPSAPAGIIGSTLVCAGTQKSYLVATNPNATSYSWTVPSGVQVIQGQGSNQLLIEFANNYTTAPLCVNANNSCGSSAQTCISMVRQQGRFCPRRVPTSWGDKAENPDLLTADDLILNIQPNPAKENAALIIDGTIAGKGNLTLIDVLGKVIYTEDVVLVDETTVLPLKIQNLPKGVYMVNLKQGTLSLNTRLVVE